MIRYSLVCKAGHVFDGWFPGIEACDKQLKKGLVACPDCGSSKVKKALMAPAIAPKKSDSDAARKRVMAFAEHRAKLAALREHVEQNFENVGERFPEEARRIHYGEAERRDIYGEASLAEAKELVEEGVEVAALPGPIRTDA
ncbi:MAG: DUF1178 family protein [Alphaproteobacteria bacterium]